MRPSRHLARAWPLLAALALAPASAPAQILFEPDPAERPLGLSISGGISLGSYQAGVNWALLELYRHSAWDPGFAGYRVPKYRLRTVTGASAGNVNTLLWALEACTDERTPGRPYRSPSPESSLFWQVWTGLGIDQLLQADGSDAAVFSREAAVRVARRGVVERMASPRLRAGCTVPAGITLTRVRPDTFEFQGLAIETMRFATPFRAVVGSAAGPDGSRVRFEQLGNGIDRDRRAGLVVRLAPHDGPIPLDTLLRAVKAFAAFPVAFAPETLTVWRPRSGYERENVFVDGGFFDNNPLGLARDVYRAGNPGVRANTLDVLYINPGRYRGALDSVRRAGGKPIPAAGLAVVGTELKNAVATARQYELQIVARERVADDLRAEVAEMAAEYNQLAESYNRLPAGVRGARRAERRNMPAPEARMALVLSSRAYPVFGEHLSAFAAFLGRPAREFDFHVGTYDGLYTAALEHTCAAPPEGGEWPDDASRERCVARTMAEWIRGGRIVGDPARQVLALLWDHEFSEALGRSLAGEPEMAPDTAADPTLRDRLAVQRGLFVALGTQLRRPDPERCRGWKVAVMTLMCRDGIGMVLDTLAVQPRVLEVLGRWREECGEEVCLAEPTFAGLVEERAGERKRATTAHDLLDRVLARLVAVERRMKDDRASDKDDAYEVLTYGQWLYHTTHLRTRRRDEVPTSIPETERGLNLFLPMYVGGNLGTRGAELRWEWARNSSTAWGTHLTGIAHAAGAPFADGTRYHLGGGAGAGLFLADFRVSEVGAEVHGFIPAGVRGRPRYDAELYGLFFARRLRAALWANVKGDFGDRGKVGLSAGLYDLPGLLYWLTR